MNIKEGVTVYTCDHCKRKMFRRHSMELHEKWCNANPENGRACTGCLHLQESENSYTRTEAIYNVFGDIEPDFIEVKTKAFKCEKLGQMLYPFKVEKLKLVDKYPGTFDGQQPMPKECPHQKLF